MTKIDQIETLILDIPTIRGHVLSMATMRTQTAVLVLVRFADGSEGIGEGTTIGGPSYGEESPETIKSAIDTYVAPALVGRNGGDVNGAVKLGVVHRDEAQVHLGIIRAVGFDDIGHDAKGGKPQKANVQAAFGAMAQIADLELCILKLGKDRIAARQQAFPCLREEDRAAAPVEQDRAQLLLNLLDLAAERRLRHVQPFGRTAKVQLLGHGDEIGQLFEVHPGRPPLWSG